MFSRSCLVLAFFLPAACPAAEKPAAFQMQLLALHNAARAEAKLPPLAHDALLARAAQAHAQHMARTGKFAHDGIGNGTIASRIDDAGYAWAHAAENIAWTRAAARDEARAAMNKWLASPPHRAHILGEDREVGFGRAASADGKVFWVACFGTPQE